jgi:mono/diheme cytochrome c family protein
VWVASLVFACLGAAIFSRPHAAATPPTSFKRQVLPILKQHCLICHNPQGVEVNLDLRSYQGLMAGSLFGVAVIPGHAESSPLVAVLKPNSPSKMPPVGRPLSFEEIDVISRWIQEGAKDN